GEERYAHRGSWLVLQRRKAMPLLPSGDVLVEQQRFSRRDHLPHESEVGEWYRFVVKADVALDRVWEVQDARRLVVDGDVDDLGVGDLLDLVADDVVDRLRVELARDRDLNAVDQCQLGI